MSDEIKEIMDEILWQFEKHPIDGDYLLEEKSAKAIYDYITNLQEENQRLIAKNLELETLCDTYEEEHNTVFQEWLKELKEGNK